MEQAARLLNTGVFVDVSGGYRICFMFSILHPLWSWVILPVW
jgi:hypothetical protein